MIRTNPDAIYDVHTRCSLPYILHIICMLSEQLIHVLDQRQVFRFKNEATTWSLDLEQQL